MLPCGERSIRFRPALSVSNDEIDEAVSAVARAVSRVLGQQSSSQNDLEESSK